MRRAAAVVTVLWVILGLVACGAPQVDWTLKIGGAVSQPLALSFADLARMEQADLKDILMQRSLGEDTVSSWSGVPLEKILTQAGASPNLVSVTATAADGYAVEISRDELQGAIIALKENGKWIAQADPDHGPIRLVCPHTPANRWVFQLQELRINE